VKTELNTNVMPFLLVLLLSYFDLRKNNIIVMWDRILLQNSATIEIMRLLVSDRTDVCCCSCLTVTLVETELSFYIDFCCFVTICSRSTL